MGMISRVHVRLGIRRPRNSPSSAENAVNSRDTAVSIASSAAVIGTASAAQTRHTATGTAVSSSCIVSLARSTCHGVTGSDCICHRHLPSKETEGAAMSFMATIMHTTAASSTGKAS